MGRETLPDRGQAGRQRLAARGSRQNGQPKRNPASGTLGAVLSARYALPGAGVILIICAIGIAAMVYKAANAEKPDPNAEVAALAAEKADLAAAAIDAKLIDVGELLMRLEKRGGAKPGGGGAMKLASRAFGKTRGLEQLAAYGFDGKTRWVMRPAKRGRILFPESKRFVEEHLASPGLGLRLGAPFRPVKGGRLWTPVTYIVEGKSPRRSAVLVAFLRADALQPLVAQAGEAAALFTENGVLAAAEPVENAAVGASFETLPSFQRIKGDVEASGAYLREAAFGPERHAMVGFRRLDCCGGLVTAVTPAEAPPAPPSAAGQWLALAAAALLILLAIGVIVRWAAISARDPWRDFGADKTQPSA